MCGIGGYAGDPGGFDEEVMLRALHHRGPDHEGRRSLSAQDGTPVWLGFARLSILDLTPAGNQPMSTEDGALTIIYNGETYNFAALREELERRGHAFRSTGDTEVVLRGYREWGPAVVERMRGMFAFALWDAPRGQLVLGRDRLGIKPLYYYWHDDGRRLIFASELRALVRGAGLVPRLDPHALHGYLALGSVPQPRTILRDVRLLQPGHLLCARVAAGGVQQPVERRYFRLPVPAPGERASSAADQEAAVARVAAVLEEAVGLRLVADVKVGILLSGGMDSTALAVLAARAGQARARTGTVETFTLTYGDGYAESEGREAERVAGLLGMEHHEQVVRAADLLGRVPAFLQVMDQPSVDGFNTYLVAQVVREAGVKVALGGLGGDEVFLGYGLRRGFRAAYAAGGCLDALPGARALRLERALPRLLGGRPALPLGMRLKLDKGLGLLHATLQPPEDRAAGVYAALRGLFHRAQLGQLLDPDLGLAELDPAAHVQLGLARDEISSLPPDALLSYLEMGNYLSNTLLRDADVMSMAHGVELRVPLCDHLLVATVMAASVATPGLLSARGRDQAQKPLLLRASRSELVAQAAARRKRGFVLPIHAWLRRELLPEVSAVLHDAATIRAAGMVPGAVSRLWQGYLAGGAGGAFVSGAAWRVWALFTLLSWVRRHGASL